MGVDGGGLSSIGRVDKGEIGDVDYTRVIGEGGGLCNPHLLCEEDPPTPQQPSIGALGATSEVDGEHVIGAHEGIGTVLHVVSSTLPP